MDFNVFIQKLTSGLTPEQASVVRGAIERESVKEYAATLKQQDEYNTLVAQQQTLQAELEGAGGQPGTRAYAEWYKSNYDSIVATQNRIKAYETKYGNLDAPSPNPTPAPQAGGLTKEDIAKLVQEQLQGSMGGVATTIKTAGKIVQRHMLRGRKNEIDFETIDKMMGEKSLSLEAAYDEWDKPERDKEQATATENEIKRRVKEELQKSRAAAEFPGSDGGGATVLARRTNAEVEKFDKTSLLRDLANGWNESENAA